MLKRVLSIIFILFGLFGFAQSSKAYDLPAQTGEVISIDYIDTPENSSVSTSSRQLVKVKIKSGQFGGEELLLDNMLTGNPAYDINLKKGDNVVLHAESEIPEVTDIDDVKFFISDLKRVNILLGALIVFCVFLILIGRKKGVFSLVSMIATGGLIFCGLVPMILHGFWPIIATVIVAIFSTIITIYLVGGFNSKSTSAILGTSASLIFAGILAQLTIFYAHLTGFSGEENIFLYNAHPYLNFKGILAASIIIAALGALMDTAVSIASTINEIHETDSSLTVKQLFSSGMNVGRDIIGTMSNTLILVYLGSSLSLVLLSNNIDLYKFFNLNQVATEISSALVGSIAILLCVPLTAIISALLIKRNSKQEFNFDKNSNIKD
jgi:uncharacterized membrane protein